VGRTGSLRQALRERADERADWRAAEDFFATLLGRVDFCSPHALFTEALGHLGGRARIFARLGAEAEEPIAEFLQTALSYARLHPPSLQGFLHWLRRSGAEVKREQEEAGGAVRIMTVHGAKGLQAPLVILPDTTGLPPMDEAVHWAADGDAAIPVLVPNAAFRGAAGERLRAAAVRRQMQEYNRQLYVALTRAQDRLVVCGWKGGKPVPDTSWYRLVEDGFGRLAEARREAFDLWEGETVWLETARPVAGKTTQPDAGKTEPPALPAWAGTAPDWRAPPLPEETGLPEPLAPSRPEGVELGHVPAAASPLAEREPGGARFQRGKLVHALLQHLPELPSARRPEVARAWLARPGQGIAAGQVDGLADEVLAILDHPDLAGLFGPGSQAEVPLTGVVDGRVIGGLVDRLAVSPERVLIADYKTNREQPATAAETPVLYLRQMAAYRAVLRAVFPGREVGCVLIWTRSARAVMLPAELLDVHAPSVPLGMAPA
jgi:ATP-dependent helicase/nuclease subunit A